MICDLLALRPISHITKKTLSYLHSTKIEQMTKTMVIFLKRRHFSLLHSLQSNTTTNFRPAARAYWQRYHLLLERFTINGFSRILSSHIRPLNLCKMPFRNFRQKRELQYLEKYALLCRVFKFVIK